jgi:hypothetical protein
MFTIPTTLNLYKSLNINPNEIEDEYCLGADINFEYILNM